MVFAGRREGLGERVVGVERGGFEVPVLLADRVRAVVGIGPVTVVPGATTRAGGVKLKLSMRTAAELAASAVSPAEGPSGIAATSAMPSPNAASRAVIFQWAIIRLPQALSGVSMTARGLLPGT